MRYNARKKISIYSLSDTEVGEYGEQIVVKHLFYTGTQLVVPMTSTIVKKDYGIDTNKPKKIIFNKPLPNDVALLIYVDNEYYSVLERNNFDKFNILLIDVDHKGGEYQDGE